MRYAIILIVLAILAGILGPQTFFVVDETQLAIVTRFGDPVRPSISSPGIYTKAPFIERVTYFDKRRALFDAPSQDFLTEDKRRLIIDAYAVARIVDPLTFFKTVRTQQGAVTRGTDIINSELRLEIANDLQSEIIRTNREAIMLQVRDTVAPELSEFGVMTTDVRIKRADFPDEVADSIYERMRAERLEQANAERAEGARQDLEIRAAVDRQATVIRAEAERDANITRGRGEAEAIRILASALEQDPEFYAFQRSLEAYRKSLSENTTVVLPASSDLFQFLQSPDGIDGDIDEQDAPAPGIIAVESIAMRFLSGQLDADAGEPTLMRAERVEWNDGSLGCPEPGIAYTQAIVPGYNFVYEVGRRLLRGALGHRRDPDGWMLPIDSGEPTSHLPTSIPARRTVSPRPHGAEHD